ncbi:HIT family protein [Moheibacter sediminis]|uniref:Histidine triad (HIT) family protein n=1 Tax=Moheibacter sediminis TaxID=1434700 RepID=A0A1W2BPH8_9FLAO|nr:HIT domain-containing protein [Moheibacter sediminis]SMC74756.1 histidine triad (HIT) family protein [Moheibacter sediminis]
MASVFTKIINGEIPAFKIAENEDYMAFLDVFPLVKGHTLVIPKQEVDKIFEMDKSLYLGLMDFAYDVAQAVEKAIPCIRVGIAVIGLEVPHTHVHLVPLNTIQDINFTNTKLKLENEEMIEIAEKIKSFL